METNRKKEEYVFNFETGGWNSIHAYSVEEARELARIKYKDEDRLKPIMDSFRIPTKEEYMNLLSSFY